MKAKSKVIRYYCREFKSWVFHWVDDNGNQTCDAMYQYNKPSMKECKEVLEKYAKIYN